MHSKKVPCKRDGFEANTAAHAREMETPYITSESEMVNNCCGEGRCWTEHTTASYEDVNGSRVNLMLGEEILDDCEHDGFDVELSQMERLNRGELVGGNRQAGLVAEAGVLQDLCLEDDATLVEYVADVEVLYAGGKRDAAVVRWAVAGQVDEVDFFPRAAGEV